MELVELPADGNIKYYSYLFISFFAETNSETTLRVSVRHLNKLIQVKMGWYQDQS